MYTIYISSTFNDLIPFRAAVHRSLDTLGHRTVAMESYVATDKRPVEKCVDDVAACDLYVGILAWRYGFIPSTSNPDHKSITELEYDSAGRHDRPRLMFLLDRTTPWPPDFLDATTGEGGRGARIDQFRARATADHVVSYFESPQDLSSKTSVAVARLAQRFATSERPDALILRRLTQLIPIAARLRAQLESARSAHEAADVQFVTGSLLLALLRSSDRFAASRFDSVRGGLASAVAEILTRYVQDDLPRLAPGYVPFDWGERRDVQRAQDYALLDGSPAVNTKHLLRAVLESGESSTISGLKRHLGEPTFDQLVRSVREAEAEPARVASPLPVFP